MLAKTLCGVIFLLGCIWIQMDASEMMSQPKTLIKNSAEFSALYPQLEKFQDEKAPQKTWFYIIRHGESTSNFEKSIAGRTLDVSLTEKGVEQAEKAGLLLSVKVPVFEAAYSSPTRRTLETAETIGSIWLELRKPPLPELTCDEALFEKFYGPLEGASDAVYSKFKKIEEKETACLTTFEEKFQYKPLPEMESMADIYNRVIPFLQKLAKKHPGEHILISTHNGVMKSLLMADAAMHKNAELEYRSFEVGNASILLMEFDNSFKIQATYEVYFRS